MTVGEGFYRQPIALIGHDGLELRGNGREPVSLPPREKSMTRDYIFDIINRIKKQADIFLLTFQGPSPI